MARTSVTSDVRAHKFAAAKPDLLYSEQAVTQVVRWLTRLPDPDDILRKTGKGRATLRSLEFDDEIAQCLDTRREAVIGTPWRLEPQENPAAEFLTEQLEPWIEDILRASLNAVFYGYSVIEIVYAPIGGRVGISYLSEKPLEWFVPQQDGTVHYYPDNGTGGLNGLVVDPRKFFLTRRQGRYINPYGEALLSRLYWPFYFKTQGRKFWAQFLERFGFPILVGSVPDGQAFVDALNGMGMVSPIAIPPGSSVEAIAATQAGEFERFDQTFARSVQKMILGQTLTSDVGSTGSYAAAKVHDSVREDKRNADIRLVTKTVQNIVNTLAELNFVQPSEFVMADDTGLEVDRVNRDAVMAEKLGVKFTKSYFVDRYDLCEEDFDVVEKAVQDTQTLPQGQVNDKMPDQMPEDQAQMAIKKQSFTPQQQAIEDGIDGVLGSLGDVIANEEIKAAIRASSDVESMIDNLARLLPNATQSEFGKVVERALFAADIMGYAHARNQ